MRYSYLSLLVFSIFPIVLRAQVNTAARVLDKDIKTVQINPASPYPVVDLKSGQINLSFDRIGFDLKNYLYTIVHCNSDWQPSVLEDNEYINGFTEDRITSINSSVNTLQPYTRYQITLPNQNMRWAVSGNYILKVFDEDNDRELVMVRRFMVMESKWSVSAQMAQIFHAGKIFTHQEIDFQVLHEGTVINNPIREVKAFIYQNMRWDRVMGPVAPRPFVTLRNSMNFDYQDSIVFPAGKSWRFFDMRSFDFRGNNVQKIERNAVTWQVFLKPETDQSESHTYALTDDINGRFSIENRTPGQTFMQTDYANVLFVLQRNAPFENKEVYVIGEMTDWRLRDEFKMEYDEVSHSYFCNPLLKQGYYNYAFSVVDAETYEPSADDDMEGDWHETGNIYTIMVYYRPFGERYDRLMTVGGVDSRTWKK
jgi:hypothetical protein